MTMTDFRGAALPLTDAGIAAACRATGAEPADIWAVLSVETKGTGFLPDGRPRILFERHIFSSRTGSRFDQSHPSISHREPGGYSRKGSDEYYKLHEAIALDRKAALESASWGIGQVMGFNFRAVGASSAEVLVTQAMNSEDDQLMHMARFICSERLDGALRPHDWVTFAKGYNGPGYARNKYDIRLRQQHAKWAAGPLPDLAVRADQIRLSRKGLYAGSIDGIMGKFTRSALEAETGAA